MGNVGAIILAAGGSSRLGQAKQLLMFGGETLVRRAVRAATEAHCAPVVVVVGDSGNAIRDELRETAAVIVENPDWERGLGGSIRCGLEYLTGLASPTGAVVLLTCDQPSVEAKTITALISEQDKTGKPMVASSYANTLGVPALFDRSRFKALLSLSDDSGAKSLIAARPNDVAAVGFEQGALDIDTPEDLEQLR
jgi:CTP:molybdopterin cytidylyltransferase MocA